MMEGVVDVEKSLLSIWINILPNFICCDFYVAHLAHTLKEVRTYYVSNRNNNLSQYFRNPSDFLSLQIKVITLSGFAKLLICTSLQALWLHEDKKSVIK